MDKILPAVFIPSPRRLARGLRFCGAAVALHGVLLGLFAALNAFFPGMPETLAEVFFWALALPALFLASPFSSMLWSLGLMNAPGWFAWPKPLGIALAYSIWVALAFGLAHVVQWWSTRTQRPRRQP